MANSINQISVSGTFANWLDATNAGIIELNSLNNGTYDKTAGLLKISSTSNPGLQVTSNAEFSGILKVTGASSLFTCNTNASVAGLLTLSNTSNGLVVTSNTTTANLTVTKRATMNVFTANTISITGLLTLANDSTGNSIVATGNAYFRNLYTTGNTIINVVSSTSIDTVDVTATGYVRAPNAVFSSKVITDILQANSSTNTRTSSATGNAYANIVIANTSMNTVTMNSSTAGFDTIYVTNKITTDNVRISSNVDATGANVIIKDVTTTGNISTRGTIQTSQISYLNTKLILNNNASSAVDAFYSANRAADPEAAIKWDETAREWYTKDVISLNYRKIITANDYSTTSVNGIVKLVDSVVSSSITTAATPASVNAVHIITTSAFNQANTAYNSRTTLQDETGSASTFYPVFTSLSSGTMTLANVATTKLTYQPSTGKLSSTIFNTTSDITLKENVKPITRALDIVNELEGVSFNWIDNGEKSYGVIAQELENIIPDLVTDLDGIKSVNYMGLIGFLINAIKELDAKVIALGGK